MNKVLGVILAGGLSRRMGGQNKSFLKLGDKPMLTHVIDRAMGQVDKLIINANAPADHYSDYNLTVVPDQVPDFAGPLAGIHTAMAYARTHDYNWLVSFSCDAPFVPLDFTATCLKTAKKTGGKIVMATSNGRTHPVAGLWSIDLMESLLEFLAAGDRKVDLWTAKQATELQDFPLENQLDPFFNVNRPDDLEKAAAQLVTRYQG